MPAAALALLLTVLLTACGSQPPAADYQSDYASWSAYAGSSDSAQFSSLTQITPANVAELEVAWSYPTGESDRYFFAPIVANGLAYVLAKGSSIVALDAATGEEVWTHAPAPDMIAITNRGINYWQSADASESRILYAEDHFLIALDARTGEVVSSFGQE